MDEIAEVVDAVVERVVDIDDAVGLKHFNHRLQFKMGAHWGATWVTGPSSYA